MYIYIYRKYKYKYLHIFIGNGYSDTSSNPGRDWLHFTKH